MNPAALHAIHHKLSAYPGFVVTVRFLSDGKGNMHELFYSTTRMI